MARKPTPSPYQPVALGQAPEQAEETSRLRKIPIADYQQSWWPEAAFLALGLFAFTAIIAVLVSHDGKAIGAWPLFVSLNTLIAILGTTARASLAFAIASCLGQQKWNWFASRGATLAAFETFDSAVRGAAWGSSAALLVKA